MKDYIFRCVTDALGEIVNVFWQSEANSNEEFLQKSTLPLIMILFDIKQLI